MRTRSRRAGGVSMGKPLENSSRSRESMSCRGGHLNVWVLNPLTHIPLDSSRYTTYEIAIETDNIAFNLPKSYVRRRFSEFVWLRKRLIEAYPELKVPALPPKTLWGGQFDPCVIEMRLRGLRIFLLRVLCQRLFLSDSTLHLFLQTSLSTDQITEVTEGRTEKDVIQTVLEAGSVSVLLKRCDSCDQSLASSSGYDSASCSSDDNTVTGRPLRPVPIPVSLGGSTDPHTDLQPGGSQLEGSEKPILSSTPCDVTDSQDRVVLSPCESVTSLDSEFMQLSVSREDSDIDSVSSCSPPSRPAQKSLLSQSVPTMQVPIKCHHRRQRRVTFSTEVTVAKVLDKVDQSEDNSKVSLVKVHNVKDKTKGH